jgi:peptidyl-tRNA hydrolase
MYEGPDVAPEDIVTVYVVINGSLDMSTGKTAAQVWHTGWRLILEFQRNWATHYRESAQAMREWYNQGQRVAVRLAETQFLFDRVMAETEGVAQQDEGMNEVERGAVTVWVTRPYRRDEVPKILNHKKVQAYGDPRGLLR